MSRAALDLIAHMAMPILARSGDQVATAGAALVIAPGLALVSQHIINAFAEHFNVPRPDGDQSQLGLTLCQIVDGAPDGLWQVTSITRSRYTDLAVVVFEAASGRARPDLLRRAELQVAAPRVGSEVAVFGFNNSPADVIFGSDGPRVSWDLQCAGARGVVSRVLDTGQPGTRLDWPSFRVEARLDGDVTGGPVFDIASGCLCGFVVAPDAFDQALYAVALWPAMAIAFTVGSDGGAPRMRTLLDLAREKIIGVRDWERVLLEEDAAGNVTRATLKNQ